MQKSCWKDPIFHKFSCFFLESFGINRLSMNMNCKWSFWTVEATNKMCQGKVAPLKEKLAMIVIRSHPIPTTWRFILAYKLWNCAGSSLETSCRVESTFHSPFKTKNISPLKQGPRSLCAPHFLLRKAHFQGDMSNSNVNVLSLEILLPSYTLWFVSYHHSLFPAQNLDQMWKTKHLESAKATWRWTIVAYNELIIPMFLRRELNLGDVMP